MAQKSQSPARGKAKLSAKKASTKTARPVAPARTAKSSAKTKPAKTAVAKSPKVAAVKTPPPAKPNSTKVKPVTPTKIVAPTPVDRGAKPAAAPPAPALARAKTALKKQRASAEAAPKSDKPRARKITIEINANEAAHQLAAKWSTLYKRADHIEAKPYNMKASYEERTAIVHKVLGWGYILANRNDRLEVLFKDGIKYLISNYKP